MYTDKSEENIVIDLPIEQKFNPKTFSIRDSDIRHDLDFKNLPNFACYTTIQELEKMETFESNVKLQGSFSAPYFERDQPQVLPSGLQIQELLEKLESFQDVSTAS